LPRDGRLATSEPLEYTVVEIGEPLETKRQLSRGADRFSRFAWSLGIVTAIHLWRAVGVSIVSIWDAATPKARIGGRTFSAAEPGIAQDLSLKPEQIGFDSGRLP
jgi:hypothetical protein